MITTVAPAKINWTLEVLGSRQDGYHEVRTVLQSIELHDEITAEPIDSKIEVTGSPFARSEDLVCRAAAAFLDLRPSTGVRLHVRKRIPPAAGLGGGSSDAAATIRLLDQMAGPIGNEAHSLAVSLGSDVSFFLSGGTALAEGRGEIVTPLPDMPQSWLVLVVPALSIADKTRTMYSALIPADYTDGSRTAALVNAVRNGQTPAEGALCNAFERAAFERFSVLQVLRDWMLQAGAPGVHLCGAGPSLFALASGEPEARAIRARLNRQRRGERVHVVRTATSAESTLTWRT